MLHSPIPCNEYQTLLRSHDFSGQLQVISVNFDRSKKLFEEIVRKDNLDAKSQFYVQGDKAAKIIDDYRLKDGYQTFFGASPSKETPRVLFVFTVQFSGPS